MLLADKTQYKQQGFTLLEIMLVVLLMGMVTTAVVMTIPNTVNKEKDVNWLAQQFSTLLQFAEDESLISGSELAIVFDNNSYQFAQYNFEKKKWLAYQGEQIVSKVELPDGIQIEHKLLGSVWDEIAIQDDDVFIDEEYLVQIEDEEEEEEKSLTPQVYVMSSGEVTPFSLRFSLMQGDSEKQSITVSVSMSGTISRSELDKS